MTTNLEELRSSFEVLIFTNFSTFDSILVQDNRDLQNRVTQSVVSDMGEMRSMHDELAILEESG